MLNKSLKIALASFILTICSSGIFAQNDSTKNVLSGVQVGSATLYEVQLISGYTFKAKILSVKSDKALMMLAKGNSMNIAIKDILSVKEIKKSDIGSVGIGFGIPYGVLGFNSELKLFKPLYASVGIGTGIFVNPMYNVGLKCFLRQEKYNFRPRIGASYGTAAMLVVMESGGGFIERKKYNSGCLNAGFQYIFNASKTLGFDIDIIYILDDSELEKDMDRIVAEHPGNDFDLKATGNVKVSMGLRYFF